jgi:hypothetical protein
VVAMAACELFRIAAEAVLKQPRGPMILLRRDPPIVLGECECQARPLSRGDGRIPFRKRPRGGIGGGLDAESSFFTR